MSFSQGWDAGFKAVLIYLGTIFLWLIFLESWFSSQAFSVTTMNAVALVAAIGFFIRRRFVCIRERRAAENEVAKIMAGVE